MADNIIDIIDEIAAAENDISGNAVIDVETKNERLKSDNPDKCLFNITFDDFEDLPSNKGQRVVSSEFSCFGNQWRLIIYPGGDQKSLDGMVSVYLRRCSWDRKLTI